MAIDASATEAAKAPSQPTGPVYETEEKYNEDIRDLRLDRAKLVMERMRAIATVNNIDFAIAHCDYLMECLERDRFNKVTGTELYGGDETPTPDHKSSYDKDPEKPSVSKCAECRCQDEPTAKDGGSN